MLDGSREEMSDVHSSVFADGIAPWPIDMAPVLKARIPGQWRCDKVIISRCFRVCCLPGRHLYVSSHLLPT